MGDEDTRAPRDDAAGAAGSGDPAAPEQGVDTAAEEAAAKARAEAAAKAKAAKEAAEAAKPPWERDPQVPEWSEAAGDPMVAALRSAHGDGVVWARTLGDELVIRVDPSAIRRVAQSLHDEHGFTLLIDICGAHYPTREEQPPFEVVYHLLNLDNGERVRLKVATAEDSPVPSVVPVWRGANWPEREVFDMYGVRFAEHPDMTRILMWEGFNGHPLRKDFPVQGIDTGSAIYPEYYDESHGPVAGTGTGWKPPRPEEEPADGDDDQGAG